MKDSALPVSAISPTHNCEDLDVAASHGAESPANSDFNRETPFDNRHDSDNQNVRSSRLFDTQSRTASASNLVTSQPSPIPHNSAEKSVRIASHQSSQLHRINKRAIAKEEKWVKQYQDLERGLSRAAEQPRGKLPGGVLRIAQLREYNARRLKLRRQGQKSPSESAAIAVAQTAMMQMLTLTTEAGAGTNAQEHMRITYARGIMGTANIVSDTLDLPEERRGKHDHRSSLLRVEGVKQGIRDYYASLKSGEVCDHLY